jgi:hypothetical protein
LGKAGKDEAEHVNKEMATFPTGHRELWDVDLSDHEIAVTSLTYLEGRRAILQTSHDMNEQRDWVFLTWHHWFGFPTALDGTADTAS